MELNDIARNSSIVLLLSFAATVIGYFLRLFLARNLTVSDYGLFYAVLAFIGFFSTFRDMELGNALAKFIPEFLVNNEKEKIKTAVVFVGLVQLTIGAVIVIPLMLLADNIAISVFGTELASLPIRLIALSFFISTIMSLLQRTFQGLGKIFYFALVEPLRLSTAFISAVLLIGMGVAGAASAYLLASVVVSLVLFIALLWAFPPIKAKPHADKRIFKKILVFSLPLVVAGFGSMIINYVDTLILTISRSVYEVGLYQAALPTSQLLWFFIGGVSAVLLPVVSALWSEGKKETLGKGISVMVKTLFVIIVPFSTVFAAFPEIILSTLFGERYLPAAFSLQILSFGAIFYTFNMVFSIILAAIGQPKMYTKLWISIGIIGLFLSVLLIPAFGIVGASLAITGSYLIGLFIGFSYAKRYFNISVSSREMVYAVFAAITLFVFVFSLKFSISIDPLIEVLLAVPVSFMLYFLFSLRFVINKNDLKNLSLIGVRLPRFLLGIVTKIVK